MDGLLKYASACAVLLLAQSLPAEQAIRSEHTLDLSLRLDLVDASSSLDSWPDGGLGKLRYDDSDRFAASRVAIDYSGRIQPSLWARVVADFVSDGSEGADVAEAFLAWRPLPRGATRHQLRAGAMYPPFSYENTAAGWTSPYTIDYSTINTWFGEEVRPVGIEWSMTRRIGAATSPHQINFFASAFYGNDPAGTLLFWRGWSVHDRQMRLGDRVAMPPFPYFDGTSVDLLEQSVAPFEETDSTPGVYAGLEWRYSTRVKAQIGTWDNRADPYSYAHRQWGWDTRFRTASVQAQLPWDVGLIAQWLRGDTGWIAFARPDGSLLGEAFVVVDEFESAFVLLTRRIGARHRATLRYEEFAIERPGSVMFAQTDDGHALTLAYRFMPSERINTAVEWLEIESNRDLWLLYGLPRTARERLFTVQLMIDLSF